jgi:hypothetical protein
MGEPWLIIKIIPLRNAIDSSENSFAFATISNTTSLKTKKSSTLKTAIFSH